MVIKRQNEQQRVNNGADIDPLKILSLLKAHVKDRKGRKKQGEIRSEMYGIAEESALACIANLRYLCCG